MKSRALAILSIPGFALAACSGGQSGSTGDASEAVTDATGPAAQALLEVTESQSEGWAQSLPSSTAVTVNPAAENAEFERVARAASNDAAGTGTAAEDRLQIRKEAVRYASGKTMFGPDGTGTIEELPLRAYTLRAVPPRGGLFEQGNDGSTPNYRAGQTTQNLGNGDGVLFYSTEVTESGLVLKKGGNAIYFDFQRRFDMGEDINDWYGRGPDGIRGTADDGTAGSGKWDGCYTDLIDATADCTNWIHDDIKVTFGSPASAPHGHYAWYWNTRIPLPPGVSADEDNLKANMDNLLDDVRDLGSYELWMTNLARVNKNLEDAKKPPHTIDDEAQFLSYAAYGLLVYNDNVVSWQGPGRLIGYHFGYDAFADSEDARTTDLTNAVSATFKGTTMAQTVLHLSETAPSRPSRIDLRGDIELNARIGGTGGGKISGQITGFEMLGADGTWHPYAAIIDPTKQERLVLTGTNYKTRQTSGAFSTGDIVADAATIGADGSYEGGVYLQYYDDADDSWKDKTEYFDTYVTSDYSKFGGTFYGPTGDDLSNLETAGYWFLSADARCTHRTCSADLKRTGPIYGSFGAAR